ncbi:NAD(P)/FAD-dependent oxidoreductase [Methylotuvimicrobium buryatense]|uniref:NAD(P)/FAD-dependent oxidoreductase n=1 Tax=Methylotuvimicrobium buryatense TaxID=95641 RepID=A0A4P9UIY3_METBY|nr:NAD(P)/FAD-dependent oxidoreductase [Methylotuvimicrobium buryatense]QCW81109.1 NAD(P)/FAD-dependent oxidoreductase [Methylotuvimicrobium buryatense]
MRAEKGNIVIIGAGPAGSIAAALLNNKGYRAVILERDAFPRFSIGESLLPQCMEFIEQAGMLDAVRNAGFQLKDGAAFLFQGKHCEFWFADKFTSGFDSTYQVQRDRFDALLAAEAQRMGVDIRWRQEVVEADFSGEQPVLTVKDRDSEDRYRMTADFVLDASGFGRVLPRLLDLEKPSGFPVRQAVFTHIEDRIDDPRYDRNKIRIIVHPELTDVWYWLIPFSNGRCSLGVVGEAKILKVPERDPQAVLKQFVDAEPGLSALLHNAVFDTPVNSIGGYSANVKRLHGKGYALLGNAGEFLDPVFSSGVTIAMKSASLAAEVVDRQLGGIAVDWQKEFAEPLQKGVDTFRAFVSSWYDGGLQDVVLYQQQQPNIKAMICSILAGYVWDENNPYVKNSEPRLKTLVELCREP